MTDTVSTQAAATPFVRRVLRAARLHADTYEEVEADPSSIGQAALLVVLCSLSAAWGARRVREGLVDRLPEAMLPEMLHVGVAALEPFVLWLVTGAFAYMVGATFLRGPETETDYAEVLRTTGFAFGPGLFLALASLVPVGSGAVVLTLALRLWILAAWIVAIRQALDYTTLRAVATAVVAFLLAWLLLWGLAVAL